VPYIANARQPSTSQQPYTYPFRFLAVYFYGGGGGCFAAGTQVWMGDTSMTPIENIQVGDVVYSLNLESNELERVSVSNVMEPRECKVYRLQLTDGGWLKVTGGHPFYVEDQGWKVINLEDWNKEVELGHADDMKEVNGELQVGDAIKDINNAILKQNLSESIIESIEEADEEMVYHFGVDSPHHNFFANSLMVHNISTK
jgi:intein/homing endonuclease